MSKRGNKEFLKDIKESIRRTECYIGKMNYEEFLQDIKTQDPVVRSLEIIGEAVKNLSSDFKKTHKDIDWKKIAGLRDKIIHYYFGVKWDVVWSIINEKTPDLKDKIETILKEIEKLSR